MGNNRATNMAQTSSLRIKGLPLVSEVDTAGTDLVIDAQLIAPALASGRSPLTVICSVDRSGSMAGEKLKLTMATLRFLVSQLAATDKFGLVVWDDTVQTQFSPALMDEKGKQSALEAIKQVRAGATTNLSGGLLQGLSEAISDPDLAEPGRTSSVLLFTDGLANRGLTDSAKIAECMKGALEDCSDNQPSVFTFGFGEDHDAEMLRTIADVGEGLYYYIENKEAIPQTFADCLGGLLSVVAQNMVLVVEPCEGVSILKVHSKVPTKNLNDEGGPVELTLGDVYSEEERNVLLTVRLSARDGPMDARRVCHLKLKYFDTVVAKPGLTESDVYVNCVSALPEGGAPQDAHVAAQYGRVNAAEAMEAANILGKTGKFEEGRQLLEQSRTLLQNSVGCEELQADLTECMSGMVDTRSYNSHGNKSMSNYSGAAHRERSCAFRIERAVSYQSPAKAMMCQQAAMFMEQDEDLEEEETHNPFENRLPMTATMSPQRTSTRHSNISRSLSQSLPPKPLKGEELQVPAEGMFNKLQRGMRSALSSFTPSKRVM